MIDEQGGRSRGKWRWGGARRDWALVAGGIWKRLKDRSQLANNGRFCLAPPFAQRGKICLRHRSLSLRCWQHPWCSRTLGALRLVGRGRIELTLRGFSRPHTFPRPARWTIRERVRLDHVARSLCYSESASSSTAVA